MLGAPITPLPHDSPSFATVVVGCAVAPVVPALGDEPQAIASGTRMNAMLLIMGASLKRAIAKINLGAVLMHQPHRQWRLVTRHTVPRAK
jgi:hypothetical protein